MILVLVQIVVKEFFSSSLSCFFLFVFFNKSLFLQHFFSRENIENTPRYDISRRFYTLRFTVSLGHRVIVHISGGVESCVCAARTCFLFRPGSFVSMISLGNKNKTNARDIFPFFRWRWFFFFFLMQNILSWCDFNNSKPKSEIKERWRCSKTVTREAPKHHRCVRYYPKARYLGLPCPCQAPPLRARARAPNPPPPSLPDGTLVHTIGSSATICINPPEKEK